jgi:DNA-binding SARP family transcriptional activator
LLVERDRPVPKDRIADLLWGDRQPRRVAATIETYVSVLRRRLDFGSDRDTAPSA